MDTTFIHSSPLGGATELGMPALPDPKAICTTLDCYFALFLLTNFNPQVTL